MKIEERVVSFKIFVSAPDPFCELQLFEDQVSQCQQAVVGHRDPAAPASESALSKVLQSFGWPLSEEELTELLLKAEDAQIFAVQDVHTQGGEQMCGDETECNWFTEIACEHAVQFYKAVDPGVGSLTKSQLNKSEARYFLENIHSTVQDLKEAMATIYDAFPEELTIVYKGAELPGSDTLEGLGVAYRRSHEDKLDGSDSISLKIEGPSRRKRIRDDRAQMLALKVDRCPAECGITLQQWNLRQARRQAGRRNTASGASKSTLRLCTELSCFDEFKSRENNPYKRVRALLVNE